MKDVFWLGKRVIALERDIIKMEELGGEPAPDTSKILEQMARCFGGVD